MDNIFDYNIIDPKNKKRFSKDLENLPTKGLIAIINVLIKAANTNNKFIDSELENNKLLKENIRLLEEKVRLLEDINSKYEKFFNKLN